MEAHVPVVGKGPVLTQQDLCERNEKFCQPAPFPIYPVEATTTFLNQQDLKDLEGFDKVDAEKLAEELGLSEVAEDLADKTAQAASKTADALEQHLDRVEQQELQQLGTSSRQRALA